MANLEDAFIGLPGWGKALALVGVLVLLSVGYYALVHGSISSQLQAAQSQKTQLQDQIRDAERREKQYLPASGSRQPQSTWTHRRRTGFVGSPCSCPAATWSLHSG